MKRVPISALLLSCGGIILMGLGGYFIFLRPPLLPEDPRYMGTTLDVIHATIPGLTTWLQRVFWVMGGYIFSSGALTLFVALTSFRNRTRGALGIAFLTGLASIGWMVVVNFIIGSDFKWLLLAFALPWIVGIIFFLLEGRKKSAVS